MNFDEQALALYRGLTVWCGCALQTLRHACTVKDLDLMRIQRGLCAICDEQPYSVICHGVINPVAPASFYEIRISPGKSVEEGLSFVEGRREFSRTNRNSEINTVHRISETFQEIMSV
jgi:hypothetical protein